MVATTSRKKSRGSSSRKGAASNRKQVKKRPFRREVGGGVCLLLCLCLFVSYLGVSAIVLNWLAWLIKGLFGYGYWMAGPALLLAGLILLFHHGRPVTLRVSCALVLPIIVGSLCQVVLTGGGEAAAAGFLKVLWQQGLELHSGGAVSGMIAMGSVAAFSRPVSMVVLAALLALALLGALWPVVQVLMKRHQERPRYEEQPPRIHIKEAETPVPPRTTERKHPQIDIPLGDEAAPPAQKEALPETEVLKKQRGMIPNFFRRRSEEQKTPGQVLLEEETPLQKPAPQSAPQTPQPEEQAPLPEQTPPSRKEKAAAAREVEAQTAAVTAEIEEKMAGEEGQYQFPPITLLRQGQPENHVEAGAELRNNSRRLAETLSSFGVDARAGDVIHGPSVTRYEFVLDQGVKLSKITNLSDDIALALGASGVRIAPIPDKISVVGIEVPNKQVHPVLIRDVIESREFTQHPSKVAFALGRDIGGRNVIGDIERLPHVLIAGTTGSGKSVCTNSLIVSLLYKSTPEEVRFIMVDPKMVELAPYNGIPHLLIPVVTDPKKAAGALQWAVFEMMKRYKTFSQCGVKKLEEYNRLARTREDLETLPSVVVVIDELADLMLVAAKEVEESICRVAQMGRAAGVHLVIATQRPSADVITGLMKANIPSRIAFAVASSLESRIILDTTGAEKLVGKGDMLYAPLGAGKPTRVQGCFISPEEIESVVEVVKQSGEARYDDAVIAKIDETLQEKEKGSAKGTAVSEGGEEAGDELLPAAVEVVLETGQASVSMLQRRLKLGYSRAARLVDQMEERGIVGPFEGSKPRQLLITREKWQEMQMAEGQSEEAGTEDAP